jgi:hypothetical protein
MLGIGGLPESRTGHGVCPALVDGESQHMLGGDEGLAAQVPLYLLDEM